jgi:hypothetical protein
MYNVLVYIISIPFGLLIPFAAAIPKTGKIKE